MRIPAGAVLFLFLMAGCAHPTEPVGCIPTATSPGATSTCFSTDDGWIIQAAEWKPGLDNASLIFLVHGLNEDHRSYDALAADLAAAHWRVLAFDSRGHGASTLRTDGRSERVTEFRADDYRNMERDIAGAEAHVGEVPDFLLGASIGANEALRYAADQPAPPDVILLSPGLDYHGVTTTDPNARHHGAAYFAASTEDAYAADSARALHDAHPEPAELKLWTGKGHGTQMLDADGRRHVEDWLNETNLAGPD